MSDTQSQRRKRFLFVDDDGAFLSNIREFFGELSQGIWDIQLALNHAQALAALTKGKFDLVVVDIGMPVVDGVQFLRLLNRAHPGQQVVMLTGEATEERRKECLELGALLFLEKPTAPGGFESIYAALDALAGASASEGFRGMMRRVGLQEVLQMECLGTKSSVLEIFTGRTRGKIFIRDGAIIHAERGNLQGEVALYSLLALRGGEFNLRPFAEPPKRTIQGQWEFLLMEAARLSDEGGIATADPAAEPAAATVSAPAAAPAPPTSDTEYFAAKLTSEPGETRVEEVVLCSGTGEVLYDWQCKSLERRLNLIGQIEEQAAQLANVAPVGRLERVEILTDAGRLICQIQPDRKLFVRSLGGSQ
jgi:CheY-like chemotaxis protein